MRAINKYFLFLFFVLTISYQYVDSLFRSTESFIFLGLMVVGIFFILSNTNIYFSSPVFRRFKVVYIVTICYLVYQLTMGWFSDRLADDYFYLLSKISVSGIIVVSLMKYYSFYRNLFFTYVGYLLLFLLVIGLFSSRIDVESGRLTLGFRNANSTGAFGVMVAVVFFLNKKIPNLIRIIGIAVGLLAIYLSGSRNAMLMVLIFPVVLYGKSFRVMPYGIGVLALFLGIEHYSGLGLIKSRVDEMFATDKKYHSGREVVHEIAWRMVMNKPITGYGLNGYKIIDTSVAPKDIEPENLLGSHNGYLATLKSVGVLFGGIILFILVYFPLYLLWKLRNRDDWIIKICLFFSITVLIGAYAEDFFVGINEPLTLLYFISISILGKEYYEQRKTVRISAPDVKRGLRVRANRR